MDKENNKEFLFGKLQYFNSEVMSEIGFCSLFEPKVDARVSVS